MPAIAFLLLSLTLTADEISGVQPPPLPEQARSLIEQSHSAERRFHEQEQARLIAQLEGLQRQSLVAKKANDAAAIQRYVEALKGGQPLAPEAHRRTAQWIIKRGGGVRFNGQTENHDLANGVKPKEPEFPAEMSLIGVSLPGATRPTTNDLDSLARQVPDLEILLLQGAHTIEDEDAKSLSQFRKLRQLGLSGTRIRDGGLKHLTQLKGLRSLDLSATKVTEKGLEALAALPQLRTLRLDDTRLDDRCVERLSAMKQLTTLSLRNASVSDRNVELLKKALAECQIER